MSRKALGTGLGLSALLSPTTVGRQETFSTGEPAIFSPATTGPGRSLPAKGLAVDRIVPNRYQPRVYFDEARLNALSKSIKRHGFIQPIVVRPLSDGKYELIAGERRWRAARLGGISEIPAMIREIDDQAAMEYALLENLQREDLNPIERAQAYSRLLAEFSLTQEDVSEKVGIDRSSVANTLRLLQLPEPLWKDIAEGLISMGHAKVLLSLETQKLQLQFAEEIKSKGLSVRQLTMMVKMSPKKVNTVAKVMDRKSTPDTLHLENRLLHALGTKVRVVPAGRGTSGEIKIEYYSLDDLDRIIEKLLSSSYKNNVLGTNIA